MNISLNLGGAGAFRRGLNIGAPFLGTNAESFVDYIKPDIIGEFEKGKGRPGRFGLLMGLSIFLFVMSMILMFVTGEEVPDPFFGPGTTFTVIEPNLFWLIGVFLGLAGIITFAIKLGLSASKQTKLKILRTTILEIRGRDKVSIESLSINRASFFPISKSTILLILHRLIETGNLDGYEIIGEIGIAKVNSRAKLSDFGGKNPPAAVVEEQPQVVTGRRGVCPGCGAGVGRSKGKACEFCGTGLY